MKSVRTMLAALALGLGLASAARAEDIVVTHYASLLYGTPYAVALDKGYFKQAGVDIVGDVAIATGSTDYAPYVAQIQRSNPDAVLFAIDDTSAAQLIGPAASCARGCESLVKPVTRNIAARSSCVVQSAVSMA